MSEPRRVSVRATFEPRDLWIGVYWDLRRHGYSPYRDLRIYLCIIPMLPIVFSLEWGLSKLDPVTQPLNLKRFYVWEWFNDHTKPRLINSFDDFDGAMSCALEQTFVENTNYFVVFDTKAKRSVFENDRHGYGGYGSQADIDARLAAEKVQP